MHIPMKHLTRQDWTTLALMFLLLFVCVSFSFLIDETPLESRLPYPVGVLIAIGFFLAFPVNLPFITLIHLVNGAAGSEVIPYDGYFTLMPLITAVAYTGITAAILNTVRSKTLFKAKKTA